MYVKSVIEIESSTDRLVDKKMRLLQAALVALFVVGSEVLAAPVAVGIDCCADRDRDQDRIDPLKSEVSCVGRGIASSIR